MKKLYILAILFFLLFLLIIVINNFPKDREDVGKNFLRDKGYEIIKYEGAIDRYVLSKEKLSNPSYYILWSVQDNTPFQYIDEEIYIEKYVVKNHPLDTWSSGRLVSIGNTEVRLIIVDNKVVGGISIPIIRIDDISEVIGGLNSINGKTLKQIKGISYEEWEKWFLERLNSF